MPPSRADRRRLAEQLRGRRLRRSAGVTGFLLGLTGLSICEGAIRLADRWKQNPKLPPLWGRLTWRAMLAALPALSIIDVSRQEDGMHRRRTGLLALLAAPILAFAVLASPAAAGGADLERLQLEVLGPAVQVAAGDSIGSGTVIWSEATADGGIQTLVLTNHHVVKSATKVVEEFDPRLQKDVKRSVSVPVEVILPAFNGSDLVGGERRLGKVVAYNPGMDLALVELIDRVMRMPHVARLAPKDATFTPAEPVLAVGGGLGAPPFVTEGTLAYRGEIQDGQPYQLATAPTIFGNSGGALYRLGASGHYELIGVPAKISSTFMSAVPHMGWSIQIETVRTFLTQNAKGFVVDAAEPAAPAK
jgi:S1-C subfamily serine protease